MTPGKKRKRFKGKFGCGRGLDEDTRWFIHIWRKTDGDLDVITKVFELTEKQARQKASNIRKQSKGFIKLCKGKKRNNETIQQQDICQPPQEGST
jgi:hypothetical protein